VKARLYVEEAVGERRRLLLDEDEKPFRLDLERWSEAHDRPRLDEIWWGRIRARSQAGGWFVDLGLDRDGWIEASRSIRLREGERLAVRVKAEAWAGKGPLLVRAEPAASDTRPDRPGRLLPAPEDPFLKGVEIIERCEGQEAGRRIEEAIEEGLEGRHPIPGGGRLAIETFEAMTVVDVDAGGREGRPETLAVSLNLAAAREAARLISLKGLGGLVVVDFLSMRSPPDRRETVTVFREALAARLGRASEVLELSRLGLCEAALARRARPLREALGEDPAEREALDVLRAIEREACERRGARIGARLSPAAAGWLRSDRIGWREALAARIGERWIIEDTPAPEGRWRVWSLT
jgi:Ribonuclease G/E